MSKIKKFEDLAVWQEAMLSKLIETRKNKF